MEIQTPGPGGKKSPPNPTARLQKVPAVLCGIGSPSPPPPPRHHVGSVSPLVLTGVAPEVSVLGMVTLLGFVLRESGRWGAGILPQKQCDPHASQRGPCTCTPVCSQGDGLQCSLSGSELGPCRVPMSRRTPQNPRCHGCADAMGTVVACGPDGCISPAVHGAAWTPNQGDFEAKGSQTKGTGPSHGRPQAKESLN